MLEKFLCLPCSFLRIQTRFKLATLRFEVKLPNHLAIQAYRLGQKFSRSFSLSFSVSVFLFFSLFLFSFLCFCFSFFFLSRGLIAAPSLLYTTGVVLSLPRRQCRHPSSFCPFLLCSMWQRHRQLPPTERETPKKHLGQ